MCLAGKVWAPFFRAVEAEANAQKLEISKNTLAMLKPTKLNDAFKTPVAGKRRAPL